MNGFDGAVNRVARGRGRDEGDQADLRKHRQIAQCPDRGTPEQGRELVSARAAGEAAAEELAEREQREGGAAADQPPLQPQLQEMPLEMSGDEAVPGADE